jgi:hypothetical protein
VEPVLRPLSPSDFPALVALSEEAFGAAIPERDWPWKYELSPFRAPSLVAEREGVPIAFFGAWATRYRGADVDCPGVAAVDVMSGRAARALGRVGVFRRLALAFFEANGAAGAPFVFGFPNDRHRQTGERLLDYVEVERCGELQAEPAKLGGGRLSPFRRVVRGGPFGRGHAFLAEALHARAGLRTDRSGPALDWRFRMRPGVGYDTVQLIDLLGRSRGYAVLRTYGPLTRLVDVQVRDEAGADLPELLVAVRSALPGGTTAIAVRAPRGGVLARRLTDELGFREGTSDCSLTVRRLREGFDLEAARGFDYRFCDHDIF